MALIATVSSPALSAPPERIRGRIESTSTIALHGNIHAKIRNAIDRGALNPETRIEYIRIELQPSAEQAAALEGLLEEQRDPASADYQNWLTPEQFGDRFGATAKDMDQLTSWLEGQGFAVEMAARARNWIAFSGTAQQVATTFRTELRRFEAEGEVHFANATEPSIPAALAGVVARIHGLDDFRLKPRRGAGLEAQYTTSGGAHYLAPDDFAAIYNVAVLYSAGFDGTGQKVVIPGQTNINLSDIRTFRSQFGLPAQDPQVVLFGTDPGVSRSDQMEASLDVEWAGAVARKATIIYVNSTNVISSVAYAIDHNLAPVISLSYGACESAVPASYRTLAQQANAQGITWITASGDAGAAGCDPQGGQTAKLGPAVSFPANVPEITGVGGTTFNEGGAAVWGSTNSTSGGSAKSYIPEKAWNDSATGGGIFGSTGGASQLYSKPWWQAGLGVPSDAARDVPDVALSASGAHDGYLVYNGGLMSVGGTSASAPAFAGMVSLLNQYLVAKGIRAVPGLGNINPNLYSLASSTAGVFHDITEGDNIVPCASGTKGCTAGSFGFKTGPGYDQVTGLGSVDAYNLVTKWTSLPPAVGTTMGLVAKPPSISPGASTVLSATVTPVSGSTPPTGSVTFSLGSTPLGSAAVIASGSTASSSLTVNASGLVAGSNTITAAYAATGNFANAAATVTVTLTQTTVATTTTATASPTTLAATGTTQVTATVKAASGTATPTGNVAFSLGTTSLGTAALSRGTASISIQGARFAVGANTITVTYTATGNFSSSTGGVTVTVSAPAVSTTTTVTATPATLASTGATQVTATVKAASGTATPAGNVVFALGTTSLGSVALSSGSASISIKGTSLAVGLNTITANYAGADNFAKSSGSATVTVAPAEVRTITTIAANPSTLLATGVTQLTATVKAGSGSAAPTGSVAFAAGSAALGSATLSASGLAALSVRGSSLAVGSNTITATYTGTGNFANSAGTVAVTVTTPVVSTSATLAASPASIAANATTVATATIRAASGTTPPTGAVVFSIGNTALGSAKLGASGTATLTVSGTSLAVGANTITATYAGSSGFAASAGTVTVTVTAVTAAKVTLSSSSKSVSNGVQVVLQLQEQNGVAATISNFTINGVSYAPAIGMIFGTTQLAARGTASANLSIRFSSVPVNVVFVVSGVDASGMSWTQTATVTTK